jgi:hypothetical protein
MYICAVLNLDRFVRRSDKAPELILDIVLSDQNITKLVGDALIDVDIHCICAGIWRMFLKPCAPKLKVPCLEARETVFFSFVEAIVAASARETCITKPLLLWYTLQGWVKAEHVES